MFPRICVSAILPAPPMRAAPLPPVEMDTAPAARCPAEIIRPPGRGRPLLPAAIHPAACCPWTRPDGPGPGGDPRRPAAPGHVARDPRRKQSGPNEIKTCCPFAGGDPRRPLPRPWTPAPWTRAAPAACRDPRRRSWTRRPGGPCGRARGAACCLDTSPELSTVPAGDPSGGDPGHVPDGPGPRRRSPAACCRIATTARAAPLLPLPPVRDPRHAAPRPWTRGPAPRPAPSRGRYAPQDATPTGLLLPRNAQRQRAAHPRTPAPPRHAPRAPARPRAPALASRRALARPRVYARARFRV